MADRSDLLTLTFVLATVVAVIFGIRGILSARRPTTAISRRATLPVVIVGISFSVILLAGFALQNRQLAQAKAQRRQAYAEALRRQAEIVAFALATAKVLKAPVTYGASLEPVLESDKQFAIGLLESGYPFDSTRVLWVQERGGNPTLLERFSLRALGVAVDTVWNNDDAVAVAAARTYGVVVTDQIRTTLDTAGYALMWQLKSRRLNLPVIIYSPHTNQQKREASKARGAVTETGDPGELFTVIVAMLTDADTRPVVAAASR